MLLRQSVVFALALFATPAVAITGSSQFFQKLDGATFGGTGIPNDPVAYSIFQYGNSTLLLGLSATQRFGNPPLTSDEATRSYTATTGFNDGGDPSNGLGSTWNFNLYAEVKGNEGLTLHEDFDIRIEYEFDPAENPAFDSTFGAISLRGALEDFDALNALGGNPTDAVGTATLAQDSTNLTFAFLASKSPAPFKTVIRPPVPSAAFPDGFDPNATGEYSFRIFDANRLSSTQVVMNVNVVPVPAALPLLASAFGIAALVKRRSCRA